jgi:dTMP kinase
MEGKLFVIEGTDGSGKGTQTNLLVDRLKKENYDVVMYDFPRYGERSAVFVEDYLNGKYGTAKEVGPHRGSVFYGLDRYAASFEMKKQLAEGKILIANRYISANKGHQLGKIKDPIERDNFLTWLNDFEYNMLNIPKENLTMLLYVPPQIGQKLVDQKNARSYTEKKRDIHEADLEHLMDAAEAFMYVAKKENWAVIDCTKDDDLLSIEEIHEMVYNTIKPLI